MSSIKILSCITGLLLFCTLVAAQQKLNLQQEVKLNKNEWPLDELLLEVTSQTGVPFSINTRKFPRSRKLHIKQRNQTVNRLLAEIRHTTGIAYTQVGSHIIMLDQLPAKAPAGNEAPKKSSNGTRRNTIAKNNTPKPVTPHSGTTTDSPQQAAELRPSLPAPIVYVAGSPAQAVPGISVLRKAQLKKLLSGMKPPGDLSVAGDHATTPGSSYSRSKREYQVYKGLFMQGGSTTDDVLYMHNSLMAGHTYVYGIIGYTSNFKRGGLRYGIGGSFPLNGRWNLHLQLSTGKLDFKYDSVMITKVIKTSWHQLALKAEWKFAKQLRLQFGPVYNVLKSKTNFNNSTDPFQLMPFELSMLGNHMHTLYTIKDEIGHRAGTLLKTWIGLQAGIYFNLEFSK